MTDKTPEIVGNKMQFFFNPRSIAIIGASTDPEKPGGRPLAALLKRGYAGRIYPVNPRHSEIAGVKCHPSLLDVADEVDMAIIAIPAAMVPEAMEQCGEKGVRAAVIFTSGFAEVGPEGLVLQQKVADLARQKGVRILGPNCLGLINLTNSVMASFAGIVDAEPVTPRTLGFVTQSGVFGATIYLQALERGVGFSSFVSVGNEADLEFSDFVAHLLDDAETRVVGGYLEGARDGAKLRAVAEKALGCEKPLLIMKVGRSRAGSRAASSHTGSLAGDDQIYDAFFRQMGILRIESLNELTSFVTVFRSGRRPAGANVAILSGSGGAGVVLTDKCESLGLNVPELQGATRLRLEQYLPPFASAGNPVDLTAQAEMDPGLVGNCLRALADDDNIHMVLINVHLSDRSAPVVTRDVIDFYRSTGKVVVMISWVAPGADKVPGYLDRIREAGIPLLPDGLDAVRALAGLVWYQEKAGGVAGPAGDGETTPGAGEVPAMLASPGPLPEYQGKRVLAAYGIPVTREGLATSADEAVELARRIGYPVVLKVQSPQIAHKTEAGGVMVNLADDGQVRRAYAEIITNAGKHAPDAEIHGVLVQEMINDGVEVIIGMTRDPVFGPVIMFGLGGIFVEALRDVSFKVAPLSHRDAGEMIMEIKGHRVLQGMRGRPPVDFAALMEVILQVSRLVTDHAEIKELDINPLLVSSRGAVVVDALVVTTGA
ncbi:MAG TPA: acetate--CoA ligase family protein [Spirochaetia bacterium]|nr:acetate--CoA ligase family protein [Spirochaetia bacterium]